MASANLMQMQSAVNRIAKVAGFAAITTDGGMGPNTAQGALKALSWVKQAACVDVGPSATVGKCVPAGIATSAHQLLAGIVSTSGTVDQTRLMQLNTNVTQVLNAAADTIGAPPAPPPMVATGGGGGFPTAPPPGPLLPGATGGGVLDRLRSMTASATDTIKRLPTWQKAALGLVGGIALIAGIKRVQRKGAVAS